MISSVLRSIPYYLPLFLYALCVVPNYTGDSISSTLVFVPILFVSLIALFQKLIVPELSENKIGWILWCLLFIALIWYQGDSLLIASLMFSPLPLIIIFRKRGALWIRSFNGGVIFLLCYVSLSGFGVEQLLKPKILIFTLVALAYFTCFYSHTKIKYSFLIFLVAFLFSTWIQGTSEYYWPLLLVFIPQIIHAKFQKYSSLMEYITVVGLSGYLIYYLLYGTYLIQALQGGF